MAQEPTPARPETMDVPVEASSTPPIPESILTTTRLIVRPYHAQDAPYMNLNANNAVIAKYMPLTFPHPYTIESAHSWIAMNTPLPHQTNFGIFEASSSEVLIGSIGLKLGSDVSSHTAEVGFWIGEKYWGKGYMTEALGAFTKWSFESWEGKDGQKLRRLWAKVFTGNDGSMRCFEKCGYAKEGVLIGHCEKHGEVMDLHLFGLTKVAWEARTQTS
jgi:ribosomal-protein-alanine N-acetyltransferase